MRLTPKQRDLCDTFGISLDLAEAVVRAADKKDKDKTEKDSDDKKSKTKDSDDGDEKDVESDDDESSDDDSDNPFASDDDKDVTESDEEGDASQFGNLNPSDPNAETPEEKKYKQQARLAKSADKKVSADLADQYSDKPDKVEFWPDLNASK